MIDRRHFFTTLTALPPLLPLSAGERKSAPQLSVYLPDYRIKKDFVLQLYGTTHLILFSTAALPDGSIDFTRMTAPLLSAGKEAKSSQSCRVLFCVGGWGRSTAFGAAVDSVEKRNRFVNEAVRFCETHSLDGIDLDWEFPREDEEMTNYLALIRELAREMKKTSRLVTAALAPTRLLPPDAYSHLDLVHLMSYQPWNPEEYEKWMDRSVTRALDGGIPASRISVGTPFFAKELGGERRAVSYRKIALDGPNALPSSEHPFTPVGSGAIDPRIRQIEKHGLAGAMVWDYGHDSMMPTRSMLRDLSEKLAKIPRDQP